MAEVGKVRLRHSLLNEHRVQIVARLLVKEQNISELENAFSNPLSRSTICYHLNILEDVGILESNYVILQEARTKGKAGRVYSINSQRLREALLAIDDLRNEIKV